MLKELIYQTETYVQELLSSKLPTNNYYHNIIHTRKVVALAGELSENERCSEYEKLMISLALWFHDTGYINTDCEHEEESAKIAVEFLSDKGLTSEDLDLIKHLILMTKLNEKPQTLLDKIVKDADCGHVAMDDYLDVSENLKSEICLKNDKDISEVDWLKGNLDFLKKHQFYTDYAKQYWQPKKEENQFKVQKKIDKLNSKKDKKEKNANKMGRGVETLFRVQLKNHIDLSSIADTKANILLSVNAIIISVALSNLIPKLDSPSNMFLVIPTFILMVFSVASVVLSVLSTRPNISNIEVTKDMIRNKQTNILFFGNFNKMELKDFEWGINYLIDNEDVLYDSLTKDLYYLGLVLERKYRLLRITYTVFMIGIVCSAIAFVVSYYASVIHQQ